MTTTESRSTASSDRSRPRWLVPALAVGAVLAAIVLTLTQPWLLLIDERVDEQLPTITTKPPGGGAEEVASQDAATDDAAEDGQTAEGDADPAAGGEMAEEELPTQPTEPTGPVVLASGSFISRDHATSGDVAIVQQEDGSRVLTIEHLQTDNGPDLYVYLDDDPADGPEGDFDDGIDLGRLRGNVGNLVYEIPDDVDLDAVMSVAIWCDRFSSLFGAADLTR